MSETECRHLPEPAWHPKRCPDCGALIRKPVNATLLAAAKEMLWWLKEIGFIGTPVSALHLAVTDAERVSGSEGGEVE